jgi:glycine/D-amino acid oxidase-like deaminating enzyme
VSIRQQAPVTSITLNRSGRATGATPVDGLFLCAGFGGHGYKISPAVGRLMADIVTKGHSSDPDINAQDFRLDRFAQDRPLRSGHLCVGAGEMR